MVLCLSLVLLKNYDTEKLDNPTDFFNGGDFEGYAVKTEGNSILITNNISGDNMGVWLSSTEPITIELGQYVRVWYKNNQALGSSPAKAELDRFEMINENNYSNSALTYDKAIQKALKEIENNDQFQAPVIKSIIYDDVTNTWSIEVGRMQNDYSITINVDDQN
ncbi:hypothetical protein [Halalkalibacter nanhaiisediminis]|uniref:DUF3221 domain-containing protein n=1 Tax=Halalkalibacter nanhaiisediminis TaxID=688079 RepID=A0A562QML8_9BACI|nr:hypothetical protein [Halalkalibacter nanhaiisediminis]TWI57987.1 hypothetical protein IQ10_01318 [Halalkalibacter nanhaiisediminis]